MNKEEEVQADLRRRAREITNQIKTEEKALRWITGHLDEAFDVVKAKMTKIYKNFIFKQFLLFILIYLKCLWP